MALTDYKITDGDISSHGVVSAPDKLAGTAAENKAVFDALIRDAVKAKFNDLIDELVTDLAGKMVSPGSYGSAGQYLQTNGDGTVTWNSPSGSGDMQRSVYDTDEDGTVNSADYATAAGTATEAGSAGSCTGNSATASKLSTARNLYISDADETHTGAAVAFDGSANKTLKLPAIISAALNGNAATATKLATARTISLTDADGTNTGTAVTFDGSANKTLKLPATIKANITGNASGSSGSCTGNAATATKLATARTISLTDADGTNTGSGVSFDGSANKTLKLPATIKASLSGNAATATKLATARTISLTDADGTNAGTAITFDGSANKTLKLPATIKASLSGNAATATKLATARTIQTNLASTSTASFDGSGNVAPGVTGTLGAANGGTGKTSLKAAASALCDALEEGDLVTTMNDSVYYISQGTGGGSTYYKRPIQSLYNYVKSKLDSVYAALSHTHGGADITSPTNVTTSAGLGARKIYCKASSGVPGGSTGSVGDICIVY